MDTERGFRPDERLLDVANATRANPELPRAALAELLAQHGEMEQELSVASFTEKDAAALRAAVQRITAEVLTETDPDRAAAALNTLLTEHAGPPRLSRHDGHLWHLHVDRSDDASWEEWFTAAGALALARVLSEHGRITWGECAAHNCTILYLGTGSGSPRRYCSARCATRARVAAHRDAARRRASE